MIPTPENSMELVVKVIDLRYTEDNEILKRSETLEGYSRLLYYIKGKKAEGASLEDAIRYGVKRCIEENCIAEFLQRKGREVQQMLLQEITWEEFAELRAKEAADDSYQEGFQTGLETGREEGSQHENLRNNALIEKLMDAGRLEDLRRSASDEAYKQQLYRELGL